MLPQGKFRDFLLADSTERQDILAALFDTSMFRRIEDALKTRAAKLKKTIEEIQLGQATLLKNQKCETRQELDSARAEKAEAIAKLEPKVEELTKKETSAHTALAKAEEVEAKFKALAACQATMAGLNERAPTIEVHRARVEAAKRAAGLEDIYQHLQTVAGEAKSMKERDEDAKKHLKQANEAVTKAHERLAAAKKAKPELQALQEQRTKLEGFREKLRALNAGRESAKQAEAVAAEKRQAASKANTLLATLRTDETKSRRDYDENVEKAKDLDGLNSRIEVLTTQIKARKEFDEARGKKEVAETSLADCKTKAEEAERALSTARVALGNLENARLAGQASILASTLEDGEPCPVCGSPDHPAPAALTQDVPSEQRVEDAATDAKAAEASRNAAVDLRSEAEKALAVQIEAEKGLVKRLGASADQSVDELESKLASVQQEKRAEEQRTADAADLKQKLADFAEQIESAEVAFRTANEDQQEAESASSTERGRLEQAESAVPEPYRAAGALEAEIAEATNKSEALAIELTEATTAHQEAATKQATVSAETTNAKTAAAAALEKHRKQSVAWQQRLATAGFDSEQSFVDARVDIVERERLEKQVTGFDDELTRAQALLDEAQQQTQDLERPEVEGLKEAHVAARDAIEESKADLIRSKQNLEALDKLKKGLAHSDKELHAAEASYGVVGNLAKVTRGENAKKMSFQRFVLAALLDDVLISATERLHRMSNGRYRLLRVSDHKDGRAAGGLDLEVEDAYTGKTRHVSSLSGGESFQAALALALGLADTVQSHTGGVHLETVFVDEGFGSLDPEALDLAINTLIDLQQSGRLVGVISHVGDLKERIDVRLQVTKGKGGSTAKFVLP
jgi:exonuclease SbcC